MNIEEHDVYFLCPDRFQRFGGVAANGRQLQASEPLHMAPDHVLGERFVFDYDTFDQATLDFKTKDTVNELLLRITSSV